jgi:hypothetical protein
MAFLSSTIGSNYPQFSSQTPELRSQIAEAIDALPPAHIHIPMEGEVFSTPEEAKARIFNWGFSEGFCLVFESANNVRGRWEFQCIRHHEETSNWRKGGQGE